MGSTMICVYTHALYLHTNRLITEAVYMRACQSLYVDTALKLSLHTALKLIFP